MRRSLFLIITAILFFYPFLYAQNSEVKRIEPDLSKVGMVKKMNNGKESYEFQNATTGNQEFLLDIKKVINLLDVHN